MKAFHPLLIKSYENLEIIVINDGSTDLTVSFRKISRLDERIKVIINKYDLGFINSLNIRYGCFSGKIYCENGYFDDIAKPSWIENDLPI